MNGTGAGAGETVQCAIPGTSLTAGDSYAFELYVDDGATASENATSAASTTVEVHPALAAPAAPSVSGTVLDENQVLTVTGTIPASGTSTYSWEWMVSTNGGVLASATQCASESGNGAPGGAVETCVIAGGSLPSGHNYAFALAVTDSASLAENATSNASLAVVVHTALLAPAAPTVSATGLDADQPLTVSAEIPTTGTAPYGWQWLVSANGSAFTDATGCAVAQGSGALATTTETCVLPPYALAPDATYSFELSVRDSASTPLSIDSAPSSAVTVAGALTAGAPTALFATIDLGQSAVLSANVSGGIGGLDYSWYEGASADACEARTSTIGGPDSMSVSVAPTTAMFYCYYVFDSATVGENATSPAVEILVNSALVAPVVPTVSSTSISAGTAFTISGTIPSTGTPTYSWQWLVSINGGPFANATLCGVNQGAGAAAGAIETCSVPAGGVVAGDSYQFEFHVTDSAGASISSVASATVSVTSAPPSNSSWIWVAVAVVVIAVALAAFLVLRRRRPAAPRSDAPMVTATSPGPEVQPWLEAPDASPAPSGPVVTSGPLPWQEQPTEAAVAAPVTAPILPTPVSRIPPGPVPASTRPPTVRLPPEVAPEPSKPPTPSAPVTLAPSPPAPEPVEAAAPVPPAPPAAPPSNELDFDSVMAELDDLSRTILKKSQRKPADDPSNDPTRE